MNCKEIQKLIPLFLKGLLNEEEKQEVLRHLEECSECNKELELEKEIDSGIEELFTSEFEKYSSIDYSFLKGNQFEEEEQSTNLFKRLSLGLAATILVTLTMFIFNKNREITISNPRIQCVRVSEPQIKQAVFINEKLKTKVNKLGDNVFLIQIQGGRND